jgi:hypothetical protein
MTRHAREQMAPAFKHVLSGIDEGRFGRGRRMAMLWENSE